MLNYWSYFFPSTVISSLLKVSITSCRWIFFLNKFPIHFMQVKK